MVFTFQQKVIPLFFHWLQDFYFYVSHTFSMPDSLKHALFLIHSGFILIYDLNQFCYLSYFFQYNPRFNACFNSFYMLNVFLFIITFIQKFFIFFRPNFFNKNGRSLCSACNFLEHFMSASRKYSFSMFSIFFIN